MQTAGLRIGKAADGVTARCSNYGEPRTAVAALGPQRTAGWGRDMQAGRNDGFYVPEVPATRLPELFVVDGDVTQTLRNEHALEQGAVENYPPPRIHWPNSVVLISLRTPCFLPQPIVCFIYCFPSFSLGL